VIDPHAMPCSLCGEPVDPASKFTWRRVEAWERGGLNPSRNGGHDRCLSEAQDAWAHDHCIRLAQQGLAPGQGALL
jgi:hypothetical protein